MKMKKFKKSLMLGSIAIALCSIASCGVTPKEELVLTYNFKNADGTIVEKTISATDVYNRYLETNPKDHAKAYYDTIDDIATRLAFEEGGVLSEFKESVQNAANSAISDMKNTADSAGKDWIDYLYEQGYNNDNLSDEENERLCWLDKELAEMKKKVSDEFDETFSDWYKDTTATDYATKQKYNAIWGEDGYIETNMPYAIRHILIKAGDSSDNFTSSTITSDQAKKIARVFNELTLTDGVENTFGSVAHIETDDTGSAKQNGVYAMGTATSFVNEFKLGVYTYEAILNTSTKTNYDAYTAAKGPTFNGFGLTQSHKDDLAPTGAGAKIGANYIPFQAVQKIGELADTETLNGLEVNDKNANYFPRNILFNTYFNVHNVSFITNESIKDPGASGYVAKTTNDGKQYYSDLDDNGHYANTTTAALSGAQASKFKTIPGLENPVLGDDNGNPIIIVLNATSSGGIHILSIEHDFFAGYTAGTDASDWKALSGVVGKNGTTYDVTQNEYFAPKSPIYQDGINSKNGLPFYNIPENGGKTSSTASFPFYTDTATTQNYPKKNIINNDVTMDTKSYSDFVSSVSSEITGNSYANDLKDANKFNWLTNASGLTAKNEKAKALIESYKANLEFTINQKARTTLTDAWDAYITTLTKQKSARKTGLIPVTCALHFGDDAYYGKGKICYYSKSINL